MLLSEFKDILADVQCEIFDMISEDACECYEAGVVDGVTAFVEVITDVFEEIAEI